VCSGRGGGKNGYEGILRISHFRVLSRNAMNSKESKLSEDMRRD
jgi:hypothetical protein